MLQGGGFGFHGWLVCGDLRRRAWLCVLMCLGVAVLCVVGGVFGVAVRVCVWGVSTRGGDRQEDISGREDHSCNRLNVVITLRLPPPSTI